MVKADFNGESFKLEVRTYPGEFESEDTNLLWQEYPSVPVTAFEASDPYGSLEKALILQEGSPFYEGTYVPPSDKVDFQSLKIRKLSQIKLERERAKSGGFDVPNIGRFDSDSESRSNILGCVTAAKIAQDAGQPYSITWTLADNSPAELDAQTTIDVGLALLAHVDAIHQHSRTLRQQIDAAQDLQAIAAVRWDAPTQAEAPEKTDPQPA